MSSIEYPSVHQVDPWIVEVGCKLGLIASGQESLLLSYLAKIRIVGHLILMVKQKDKTSRELNRLKSMIDYTRQSEKGDVESSGNDSCFEELADASVYP